MGLEQLKQAINEGRAYEPITRTEAEVARDEAIEDLHALKLVVQDAAVFEAYIDSKSLPQEWNRIEDLFRAYVTPQNWPNSDKPRAHLGMPLILEAIENIISQVHMAFFSDAQPFSLKAVGKTKPEAARAAAKILQWALKQAGAKEEFRKILKSILEFGQGVGKWGWQTGTHEVAKYVKEDGKVTKHPEKKDLSIPSFEFVELRHLLVDSSLRNHDIRNGRAVIHQSFISANDLDSLRDDPTYKNVPTRVELAAILAEGTSEPTDDTIGSTKGDTYRTYQAEREDKPASADPMEQPLEILEWTSNDRVITVLQRKIVIRNEENEFGRVNFNSCGFIDVIGSWYCFGIGKLLEGEQRFQTGVVNAWIDALSLALNPMYHRKNGIGAQSQNINSAPGRVVNDSGELTPLNQISVSAEALGAISSSEQRANRRVGANTGGNLPNQALRTAAGSQEYTSGVETRMQYFIDNYADMVFIPVLEAFLQLCKDKLQPEQIEAILTEEEGQAYQGSDVLDIYNGQYVLEVLSSTKLAARKAMIGLVPQLIQLFQAEAVQNSLLVQKKKLDYVEFLKTVIDLTNWPSNGLIIDATDEDIQRAMQMNPAAIQAQGRLQLESDKHQNDLDLAEETATGRAGVSVVKHLLDESKGKTPEEVKPLASALTGGDQTPPPPDQPQQAPQPGNQVESAPPVHGQI